MAETKEHHLQHQSMALAAVTSRMAIDPQFAQEFAEATERGDQKTARELVARVGVSDTEVVIIPGGICLCRGSVCVCIVIRKQ